MNVDIDAFGVERSYESFYRQPSLYLNVTYDLYEVDPEVLPTVRAEIMLDDDMANNEKLKITWDIAVATNPTYNSVSQRKKKDCRIVLGLDQLTIFTGTTGRICVLHV